MSAAGAAASELPQSRLREYKHLKTLPLFKWGPGSTVLRGFTLFQAAVTTDLLNFA